MPAPMRKLSVAVSTDTVLVAATETIIATLNGVSTQAPDNIVHLRGEAHVATAVGATTHTLRIRRVGLAGALIGEANPINTPASTTVELDISEDDAPGDVAGLAYVLTIVSAVGASTVQDAYLEAVL